MITRTIQLTVLTLSLLVSLNVSAGMGTITNDVFWRTADGQPLYSQGGGIFRFADPDTGKEHYYWYGMHYKGAETYFANPVQGGGSTRFVSVTCYRSDDLVNWTFVNDVLTPAATGRSGWVGRMGVAYIKEAGKYAIAIQFGNSVLIATCDTPTGNFEKHDVIDMREYIETPNTGDQTVFTDDNGKSYLVYSKANGRNRIYLSEIGLKDGKIGLLDCHKVYDGAGREGNCMFKYKGKYYLCASDLYGWNSSNVYYLESDNIYGPYTPTNNMLKMPGAAADYGHVTQTGFFYTVKGSKEETVIYCGDRWSDFAGNGNGYNQWVPLSFIDGKPYFNSLSQWSLDAGTGEWEVGAANNYVRNGSFEADRNAIPSDRKPVQTYITGWTFEISKGNAIATHTPTSPRLNAVNTPEDRLVVIGDKSLNITDNTAFSRHIYQEIKSTPFVPLADGVYTLTAKVKSGSTFNRLSIYAESNGKTYGTDIKHNDGKWHEVVIQGVKVKNGSATIGIKADGNGGDWCWVDDITFVKAK